MSGLPATKTSEEYIAPRKDALAGSHKLLEKLHSLLPEPPPTPPEPPPRPKHIWETIRSEEPRYFVQQVQLAACKHFNLDIDQLNNQSRRVKFVRPRHIAMYLARELTGRSYPEIGRRFGGRDHTTVMHAWNKIAADLASSNPSCAADIEQIKAALA
jgi:Bacterial dnaA protein helix-turn-helix